MQIKSIEKCMNPPAYFNGKEVYRALLEHEYGVITEYIPAQTKHEAEIKANKECVRYMRRQAKEDGKWKTMSMRSGLVPAR